MVDRLDAAADLPGAGRRIRRPGADGDAGDDGDDGRA
jgi:hypothetical protein